MQGLVFEGDRLVSLAEFPDPSPRPGEVVVRVMASGMCGSDLHYYRAENDGTPAESRCIGGHERPVSWSRSDRESMAPDCP